MTIIYEVNLKIQNDTAEDYLKWLRPHIDEILKLDGFVRADLFSRNPEDEGGEKDANHVYFTVQYHLVSRQALDDYLKNHAPRMREDGLKRFGGKFTASRRVLQFVEAHQGKK